MRGVEQRDDEDGHDVVDHGEGQQESAQRPGREPAEQCQDRQREGHVGGHGHRPPLEPPAVEVDREVDERGREDPAQGGGHRNRRIAPVAERSVQRLALDLERDEVEKERHEEVVDPFPQALAELERAGSDGDLGAPEGRVAPRREIGPQQGHRRREQQQQPAAGLLSQERLERLRDAPGDRTARAQPGPPELLGRADALFCVRIGHSGALLSLPREGRPRHRHLH
jgi:hypothetical protein